MTEHLSVFVLFRAAFPVRHCHEYLYNLCIFEKDFKQNFSYMLSEPLKLSEISFLYNPNQTTLLHWQITNLNCRHLKKQTK